MGRRARAARERSAHPLPGFKLALPMLSADGTAAAFSGVTLGRSHVYRAVDDAICVHGARHPSPARWCDCGFYCFHEQAAARDLACEPDYAGAVFIEVAASGRYRRYEQGLRYARQRVRAVGIGACRCRATGQVLVDAGTGTFGWRQLEAACPGCAGTRPALSPAAFGRLAGGVPVRLDGPAAAASGPPVAGTAGAGDLAGSVALLAAEIALLQARLDDVQSRLDELVRGEG